MSPMQLCIGMQAAGQSKLSVAGDLYLLENIFEGNIATNGAAVYAEQGCGQVSCC